MSVVVGTAGHIDHGKTTLLRALTGIDADRLPEERRRGMTIDVGYAHLALPDGTVVDFVDVPGHDRLVGNMLVGAGEIDAVLLVVAADDGPNAQTIEHLELLDALGIAAGLVVITKTDLVDADRVAEVSEAVGRLVARTTLASSPVLAVSATTGEGVEALRVAMAELVARRAGAGRRRRPAGRRSRVQRQGPRHRGHRQPARRPGRDRVDPAARARRRRRSGSARSRSAGRGSRRPTAAGRRCCSARSTTRSPSAGGS